MTDLQILEQALSQLKINYKKQECSDGTICIEINEKNEPRVYKGIEYESSALFEFNKDESLKAMMFDGA